MGLNDTDDPIITSPPAGSLTSGAAGLPRIRTLTYSASDKGGGVYRQRLYVDGNVVLTETVNSNGGNCAVPFREPVPCRTSPTNASIDFDTGTLPDGPHTVRLGVSDATDVNRVLTAPWTITVGAGSGVSGAASGTSASPTTITTNNSYTSDLNTIGLLHNPISDRLANGIPPPATPWSPHTS